jgi:hypothetical protein
VPSSLLLNFNNIYLLLYRTRYPGHKIKVRQLTSINVHGMARQAF